MKKLLLFIGMIAILTVGYSQNKKSDLSTVTKKYVKPELEPDGSKDYLIGEKYQSYISTGTSILDVQTYSSIQQRINAFDDGTIGVTWMMSNNSTSWDDRGTAYNYFDGTEWGEYPTERLESKRTGFPNYTDLGANGEVNVSHAIVDGGSDFGILVARRLEKGTGEWEESFVSGPEDGVQFVWPKVMTNGDDNMTIHLLGTTYGDEYNGQENALLYYRSLDGGETWDISSMVFDEIGPDVFPTIAAETYIWAEPKGETIAFGVGFAGGNAYIFKSLNSGDTWDCTPVFETPWGGDVPADTDNYGSGDGAFSLALDDDDMVHVVFGRMRHNFQAGESYFMPYTEGVIYWNENMDVLDTTIVSSYTLDYLIDNGNLIGWVMPFEGSYELSGFGETQQSLTTYPEIAIDNKGDIFVVYSGVCVEYVFADEHYRHIWATSSKDNGFSWTESVDLNSDILYSWSECMFPDVDLTSFDDGLLHILFQQDNLPGWCYWLDNTEPTTNYFDYAAVQKEVVIGVENNLSASTFVVEDCFPNPTNGEVKFEFSISENNSVSYSLSNILGQIVDNKELGKYSAGTHRFSLDYSDLNSGTYFYTIESADKKITKKLVVK